jgi:hypothetical protein
MTADNPAANDDYWRFPPDEDVTIVCSALPAEYLASMPFTDPARPDYVRLYRFADLDALLELHGHLRAVNPACDVRIRTPDETGPDDLAAHLVLLGGVDFNTVTAELLARLEVPVRQVGRVDDDTVGGFQIEDCVFAPAVGERDGREVLIEDVAHFVRAANPLNGTRTVTICNGMHAGGTYGVVRALTDSRFRDRNAAYLRERFGRTCSVLTRVRVVLGQAVTPDWSGGEDVLHEWPRSG